MRLAKSDQDNKRNKQEDKKQAVSKYRVGIMSENWQREISPLLSFPSFLPSTTLEVSGSLSWPSFFHPIFSNPTLKMNIMVLIHSSPLRSLLEAQKFKHVYYTPSVVRNLKTTFCAKNTTCSWFYKERWLF